MINVNYSINNNKQLSFWKYSIYSICMTKKSNQKEVLNFIITVDKRSLLKEIHNFIDINNLNINYQVINITSKESRSWYRFEKYSKRIIKKIPNMWNYLSIWHFSGVSVFLDNDTIFFDDITELVLNTLKENDNLKFIFNGFWPDKTDKMPKDGRQYKFFNRYFDNSKDIKILSNKHIAGSFYIVNIRNLKEYYSSEKEYLNILFNNIKLQYGKNDKYIKVSDETFIILSQLNNSFGSSVSKYLNKHLMNTINEVDDYSHIKIKNNIKMIHLLLFDKRISHKKRRSLILSGRKNSGFRKFFNEMSKNGWDEEKVVILESKIVKVLKGIKLS